MLEEPTKLYMRDIRKGLQSNLQENFAELQNINSNYVAKEEEKAADEPMDVNESEETSADNAETEEDKEEANAEAPGEKEENGNSANDLEAPSEADNEKVESEQDGSKDV